MIFIVIQIYYLTNNNSNKLYNLRKNNNKNLLLFL